MRKILRHPGLVLILSWLVHPALAFGKECATHDRGPDRSAGLCWMPPALLLSNLVAQVGDIGTYVHTVSACLHPAPFNAQDGVDPKAKFIADVFRSLCSTHIGS